MITITYSQQVRYWFDTWLDVDETTLWCLYSEMVMGCLPPAAVEAYNAMIELAED